MGPQKGATVKQVLSVVAFGGDDDAIRLASKLYKQ